MPARRLVIEGRVQRVGYRDWAVRTAKSAGLSGWVRNLNDGRVEILAIAPEESMIDAFVEQCHEGPASATVTRIDNGPTVEPKNVKGFTKRFTA